jgi:tellurite resistance-related uncharacterized protein
VKTLPDDVTPYKRTAEFDQDTMPAGLRRAHTTKAGVWARIHVLEGRLRYRVHGEVVETHELTPETPGIVEPQVPHDVEPIDGARFFVEFLRSP